MIMPFRYIILHCIILAQKVVLDHTNWSSGHTLDNLLWLKNMNVITANYNFASAMLQNVI